MSWTGFYFAPTQEVHKTCTQVSHVKTISMILSSSIWYWSVIWEWLDQSIILVNLITFASYWVWGMFSRNWSTLSFWASLFMTRAMFVSIGTLILCKRCSSMMWPHSFSYSSWGIFGSRAIARTSYIMCACSPNGSISTHNSCW